MAFSNKVTRVDFAIGEDADFILVADACRQAEIKTAKHAVEAAHRNEAFVLPLPEDGGISGRVVFGDLNDEERDNWVARAQRPLQIKTEKIVVDAGDFFGREIGAEIGQLSNHLVLEFEPGDYTITYLVYLTSDIATDLFKRHKFSYLRLFQQSHPDQKFPTWLIDEAECRDNDVDEEWCDTIADDQIDHETEDCLVDVLLHFQRDVLAEAPATISKTSKLKWERRPPKKFPEPLRNLGAAQSASANSVTSKIASAFQAQDFGAVVPFFSKHLQSDVAAFLANLHHQASEKMTIPRRKKRGGSFAESGDWIAKADRPRCLVDVAAMQKHPYAGSMVYALVDESVRDKLFSVSFHAAFVKTNVGLRVAGIELGWEYPIERNRGRSRITNGPPCPECGQKLASDMAKQCIHCGADWH